MEQQTYFHAPAHRCQTQPAVTEQPGVKASVPTIKTVKVRMPPMFVFYASDSLETLH